MKKLALNIFLIFVTLGSLLFGNEPEEIKPRYRVSGTVLDKQAEAPLQYTTVALLSVPDSSIVNGIITDRRGKFVVSAKQPGDYILRINFIGYETIFNDISLTRDNPSTELGTILLQSSSVDIEEVSIEANTRSIEYKIDRKVVHVADQYTAVSGTAVDILKNVPSIDVDIEDNVSIRGNSNFTVLIDGRPSVLEGSEALQQFPAGMIKDIEIITNPSAKFDPEGTGGIINIITTKRTLTGLSGLVHADVGLDEKYGGDFLLNYRTDKFNYYLGGDYSNRNYPGTVERRQETYSGDTISYLNSEGDYNRGYNRYSGQAGIEWFPDEKNVFSVSGRYGYRASLGSSTVNYEEWTSYAPARNRYTNLEERERSGNYYSLNGEYTHNFNGDNREDGREHRFDVNLMYYMREGNEESLNFLLDPGGERIDGQRSTEIGPSAGFEYRLNYEQPFTRAFNIEAGAQGRNGVSDESNGLYFYDADNGEFELQDNFSHDVSYKRDINALYGLVKGEYSDLGYQLGLRGEYTFRDIHMDDQGQFNIDRWDYFPTLHLSYTPGEKNQFMASYSRRIDRPRGWYLEPFITWSDAYNVRRGDPDLQPEYIGSYEIGYQRELNETDFLSAELYYRVTENKIERVREVYRDNIMLSTYANVGTDYALGSEIMLSMEHFDWWESDFSGNFYDYRVVGDINGEELNRGRFTWSVEWNNIFKITETTRLQFYAEYDSPEVEAQETEAATFEFDGAIRQSFMNNNLILTLQVRDIFRTDRHESVIEANDFYAYRLYAHRAPIFMLNLTFRINNFRNNGDEGFGGGGDEDSFEGGEM
ncbi:MAG: TonB-dependent receptor [Bacteroidales bacterium]